MTYKEHMASGATEGEALIALMAEFALFLNNSKPKWDWRKPPETQKQADGSWLAYGRIKYE